MKKRILLFVMVASLFAITGCTNCSNSEGIQIGVGTEGFDEDPNGDNGNSGDQGSLEGFDDGDTINM